MIKTTIIKAHTVREASEKYGEASVEKIFELVANKSPKKVLEELEDEDLKKCLLFLLNGDIS